jgi:hypothetical protein
MGISELQCRMTFLLFFVVLLLSASCSLGRALLLVPLHQPFLMMGFFEIGSLKLFAQVGFKLPSS